MATDFAKNYKTERKVNRRRKYFIFGISILTAVLAGLFLGIYRSTNVLLQCLPALIAIPLFAISLFRFLRLLLSFYKKIKHLLLRCLVRWLFMSLSLVLGATVYFTYYVGLSFLTSLLYSSPLMLPIIIVSSLLVLKDEYPSETAIFYGIFIACVILPLFASAIFKIHDNITGQVSVLFIASTFFFLATSFALLFTTFFSNRASLRIRDLKAVPTYSRIIEYGCPNTIQEKSIDVSNLCFEG